MYNELFYEVAECLSTVRRVACLTGAGISAESGIPTFRENDGVWANLNPMEWATVNGFKSQPEKVWKWYESRRKRIRGVKPNPSHLTLSKLERHLESIIISTQNIDDLHIKAGSKKVLELHGNIFRNKCLDCGIGFVLEEETPKPPVCPYCGGMIRPDVVWFGEPLPQKEWNESVHAAINCEVYMVIGTSGMVRPAADLAVIAKQSGATVILINPEESELDDFADYVIPLKSGIALPEIYARMRD